MSYYIIHGLCVLYPLMQCSAYGRMLDAIAIIGKMIYLGLCIQKLSFKWAMIYSGIWSKHAFKWAKIFGVEMYFIIVIGN